MPPQNYAIAVECLRKDTGLEIPDLREISKRLGNEAQLKTFGAFTLLLSPDRIFFCIILKNHKMFGKMYVEQCRGAQILAPGRRGEHWVPLCPMFLDPQRELAPSKSSKILNQPTRSPIRTMLTDLWSKSQIHANSN